MANEKKHEDLKLEELNELNDEQLESVVGGLGVSRVGSVTLTNLSTGQKLPEDTSFGKASGTNRASSRLPKP